MLILMFASAFARIENHFFVNEVWDPFFSGLIIRWYWSEVLGIHARWSTNRKSIHRQNVESPFDHSTLWDERSELKTKFFLVVIFRLSSSKVDMMWSVPWDTLLAFDLMVVMMMMMMILRFQGYDCLCSEEGSSRSSHYFLSSMTFRVSFFKKKTGFPWSYTSYRSWCWSLFERTRYHKASCWSESYSDFLLGVDKCDWPLQF